MGKLILVGTAFAALTLPTLAHADWYLLKGLGPDDSCYVVNREPLSVERIVPGPLRYGEHCDMPVTELQQDVTTGAFTSKHLAEEALECSFRCIIRDDDDDDDQPPVLPKTPQPEPEPEPGA